jgi:hypothetical protein
MGLSPCVTYKRPCDKCGDYTCYVHFSAQQTSLSITMNKMIVALLFGAIVAMAYG